MQYRIETLPSFVVIGQEIELTNSKRNNIKISIPFWKQFNNALRQARMSQSGHWVKYAFMERRSEQLFYYCAIPKNNIVPVGFIERTIPSYTYLVVAHVGEMSKIYKTYDKIYNEILPSIRYRAQTNTFLHFEKYDYRFHWNQEHSIIEIWVPIQTIEGKKV